MRMIRKGFTTVYGDGSDFEIGKGVTLKEGKDVAIIASGIMVDEALKAQEQLAAEGISAQGHRYVHLEAARRAAHPRFRC